MPASARRRRFALVRRTLVVMLLAATTACGLDLTGTSDGFEAGAPIDASVPGRDAEADATVGPATDGAAPAPDGAALSDALAPPVPDGGPTNPPDAADVDAGCPTGLSCGGHCSPTASCNTCADGNIECGTSTPRACTASCAEDCAGSPIECYQCGIGGGATGGSCQPLATAYCFTTFYAHCRCTVDDPTTCPIDTQVCVPVLGGGECRTCGEALTDKRDCKNGNKCDAKPGGPGPGGTQVPACTG